MPRKSLSVRKEKALGLDEIDSKRISFYLVKGIEKILEGKFL